MPSRLGRPPPGQVCVAAAANKAEEPLLLLLLNTDVVVLSRNRPAVAESRDEAAKGSLMMNVFVVVYYPVSVKKYDVINIKMKHLLESIEAGCNTFFACL